MKPCVVRSQLTSAGPSLPALTCQWKLNDSSPNRRSGFKYLCLFSGGFFHLDGPTLLCLTNSYLSLTCCTCISGLDLSLTPDSYISPPTGLLGCLMGLRNITCPKLNAWSCPLKCPIPSGFLFQLMATPIFFSSSSQKPWGHFELLPFSRHFQFYGSAFKTYPKSLLTTSTPPRLVQAVIISHLTCWSLCFHAGPPL